MPMYFRKNHNLNLLKNAQKLSDTGLILPSGSSLSLKKIKKSQQQLIIFCRFNSK